MGDDFTYDLEHMKKCVEAPSIRLPSGPKTAGEILKWLLEVDFDEELKKQRGAVETTN